MSGKVSKKQLQQRNRKFAQNIIKKNMGQHKAYALSRGRKETIPSDSNSAWRVMKQPEVQQMIEELRQKYIRKADEAFEKEWEMTDDPATPPHVKQKILQGVQDRAMPQQPNISLHKHEHKYPEFLRSKEEIMDILNEPDTAEEITKRNEK